MRLIDTDAIPDKSYWCGDALSEAIETAPTIDAVPREKYERMKENAEILSKACSEKEYVVRCKNCKYWEQEGTKGICKDLYGFGRYWKPDDYCSYGERGEADDEQ